MLIFSSQVSKTLFKLFDGPRSLEPKEIDGLLVPPGKAYALLNDRLITGKPFRSEPAQEERVQVKPFIHAIQHDIQHLLDVMAPLVLGTSPTNWRQRADMAMTIDWDGKHKFKQTNKHII